MTLYPDQAEAVEAALAALHLGENPVLSLPTGSGKSIIAAAIVARLIFNLQISEVEEFAPKPARQADLPRIVVTVPSRELAEQNERALLAFLPREAVGVACAALGRRETDRQVIVGTPQSLAGAIDFDPVAVIVDECHQMPLHRGSWFARLFDALPRGRTTPRVGLSATTFRTADGALYGTPKAWFSSQPFELSVTDLVARGRLAPVRYVAPGAVMTTRGVQRTGGDYHQGQLVEANLDRVEAQVDIITRMLRRRRKAMVFAINVEHATAFREAFEAQGLPVSLIIGTMRADERRASVAAFKAGQHRIAVTVSAGLTGLDVPDIDLLASCRPTMSAIIHTQSIGRGTRPASAKADCLVLDFAQNVKSFGPVHRPHFDGSGQPLAGAAPWRGCRTCGTYNHFEAEACGYCDEVLIARHQVTAHDLEFGTIAFARETAAVEALITGQGTDRLPVETLALHAYRKRSDPTSVSVMISLGLGGDAIVRTWHKRLGSEHWRGYWRQLLGDGPAPSTLEEAYARRGELVRPAFVTIEREGSFWRVLGVEYEQAEDDSPELGDHRFAERATVARLALGA